MKILFLCAVMAGAAFGQYKMEPAGAPPSEVPAAFAALLQKEGVKILGAGNAVYCEVWLAGKVASGPKSTDQAVALPAIAQGALLGVIRFGAPARDRRGQPLKAGVYTMRYSQHPVNGDHQGVAPQRDFVLLTPAAEDKDAAAMPGFDALVAMSVKASGTPHPAVLSIWNSSVAKFPSFGKQGDNDWVLDAKAGGLGISIILIGQVEG